MSKKERSTTSTAVRSIDFDEINSAALARFGSLLSSWLPGGKFQGSEYVVKNPTRLDNREGSFKINVKTGVWSDFATGDSGGDPVLQTRQVGTLLPERRYRLHGEPKNTVCQ